MMSDSFPAFSRGWNSLGWEPFNTSARNMRSSTKRSRASTFETPARFLKPVSYPLATCSAADASFALPTLPKEKTNGVNTKAMKISAI